MLWWLTDYGTSEMHPSQVPAIWLIWHPNRYPKAGRPRMRSWRRAFHGVSGKGSERQSRVSHQLSGTGGAGDVSGAGGWWDRRFGIQVEECLIPREMHSGRQAQMRSLCGAGGVSGSGITHVETLCALLPPEAPGAAAATAKAGRQGCATLP